VLAAESCWEETGVFAFFEHGKRQENPSYALVKRFEIRPFAVP